MAALAVAAATASGVGVHPALAAPLAPSVRPASALAATETTATIQGLVKPMGGTASDGARVTAIATYSPIPSGRRRISPANPNDVGLYVAFCPASGRASSVRAIAAGTSEAGWPAKECLKMDKGPAGRHHTLVGERGLHNWLLGGYGNDTIIGGNIGDVIWGDYHPSGAPKHQTATIQAGNGRNVIYANDTVNRVWTGTNPRTVVHAHASGISGEIHCQSPGIVLFLSTTSERRFKLYGCHHISHYSVGY